MVAPMSKRRGGVGVAVAHGFLYAFGGHDAPASNPSAARFDCVERYLLLFLACNSHLTTFNHIHIQIRPSI